MQVRLRILLIGTTTIMHSAVLTIYNRRYRDCIYATHMTQTPHLTKNKSKNIKNGRLNMLLRFQQWMQTLERLLVQLIARWWWGFGCEEGQSESEFVDEVPNSFYCQAPPSTRKNITLLLLITYYLDICGLGTMIHLLSSIHLNKLVLILCEWKNPQSFQNAPQIAIWGIWVLVKWRILIRTRRKLRSGIRNIKCH